MFLFSQLTMPTLSPETLGGPLCEINMFCHLWQTLAGIPYSLGFPVLNQSNPPFLFPTSHFLGEAY